MEIFLFLLSPIARSLEQIHHFRISYTFKWIRIWLEYRGILNFDLYHFVSNYWISTSLSLLLYGINNAQEILNYEWYDWAWRSIVLWAVHGTVHDLFYHVILMTECNRDRQNIWPIKLLFIILGWVAGDED